MTRKEDPLSLLSIEVLISQVQIEFNIECHLPCVVFRLLDYPAVSIPYFDQWQVEEFHHLKRDHPNVPWRQLLSDQFYELRSANGKFVFNRGKSCLFKTYLKTLHTHLLNVPLFLLLIDQIHDQNINTSHFIASCNVKLNELIELLNRSIMKHGHDIPLVEQQTFRCALFNLMGTNIGTCDVAVRLCHYGTTILTHLPMLNDKPATTTTTTEQKVSIPSVCKKPPVGPPTDVVVKHIQFVNEKKDVGLQLSRSDLPSSSNNNKSAQTRWTSTKTRSNDYHQSKGRYLRTLEDPSLDDPTIAFYRPPPLYFNSDSDFLHMITPATTTIVEKAKENRLAYLASIPISSFDGQLDAKDDDDEHPRERTSTNTVRFDLPSSRTTKIIPKQPTLAKDFLQNFPLLRSLVEEALALQQHQYDLPIVDGRPQSAVPQRQKVVKQNLIRPKSATNTRSIRTKSVIGTKNINNTRRLYPPLKTNQMIVTKNEVRQLVDRLSKPKFNKRVEQEIALVNQDMPSQEPIIKTPRKPSKATSTIKAVSKPSLSYGTTRAHRLMAELSRARRTASEPKTADSPKTPTPPKKESVPNNRTPSLSSPQIRNTGTTSHSSLLNKVDVETATVEKNSIQQPSLRIISDNIASTVKSVSTTSQDVTLKLNQTITKTLTSTPIRMIPSHNQENNERDDDLNFSITDVTDYFTDGGESNTRPSSRQST